MTEPDSVRRWALGDKLNQVYPHDASISAPWNLEWNSACQRATYPFHYGNDELAAEFLPVAERLASEGDAALAAGGDRVQAQEFYLRSCAVYRIARFPYISGPMKRRAYEAQKRVYVRAAASVNLPLRDIDIAHSAAIEGEGKGIPAYVCLPDGATEADPCPAILVMCGLDGHRPDFTMLLEALTESDGWATILVDIPGTADCPASPQDPAAAERMCTSVLEWMKSEGTLDMRKIVCWGLSAGGYYAVRAAHTHARQFLAALGQGAGTHHFFSREWLEKGQWHEYPWTFLPALTQKFGYESTEEFLEKEQQDFSLVEAAILDMPSCRLLFINGVQDGLMPIEDSSLLLERRSPKEARFFPGLARMANPAALEVALSWLESVVRVWQPSCKC